MSCPGSTGGSGQCLRCNSPGPGTGIPWLQPLQWAPGNRGATRAAVASPFQTRATPFLEHRFDSPVYQWKRIRGSGCRRSGASPPQGSYSDDGSPGTRAVSAALVLRIATRSHQAKSTAPARAAQKPRSAYGRRALGQHMSLREVANAYGVSWFMVPVVFVVLGQILPPGPRHRAIYRPGKRRSRRGRGPCARWSRSIRARIPGACPSRRLNMAPIGHPRPATIYPARSGS